MGKRAPNGLLGKAWKFVWEDDSIWSWIVNIVLAFVLIKFIVYPGLGFALGTSYPIVAVVSSSMEHNTGFDEWWQNAGRWYAAKNITKDAFEGFPMKNGFSKGDIMVLKGVKPKELKEGDILVFISHTKRPKQDPIIHRVVNVWQENGIYYIQTKGDNPKTNRDSIDACNPEGCVDETRITEQQMIGKAVFRVPLLGYIKIAFVEMIKLIFSSVSALIGAAH